MSDPPRETTVYKYDVPIMPHLNVDMPKGAELLHVAEQHGRKYLWARVNPKEPTSLRMLSWRDTGDDEAYGEYVGTVMVDGGNYVFHLFDLGEAGQ